MVAITQIGEVSETDYGKHGLTKDVLHEMLRKMLLLMIQDQAYVGLSSATIF
jgi:hypothetical protein